jgi:hypothetical protein
MPIVSPQLDDLTYDRTVAELTRRIPVYAPKWTDFNDSDPGIALIQLFAYLAEQIGYRLNRVPEKNYIELLKLLGITLQPAHAAKTKLALLLSNPSGFVGSTLAAGARAKASKGKPPPTYETDVAVDLIPAQPIVFLTTKNPYISDLLRTDSGRDSLPSPPPRDYSDWLSVVWNGKTPKIQDMPLGPVTIPKPKHAYLWIGIDANLAVPNAAFRGARVTLTIQFDDDERPDITPSIHCSRAAKAASNPPAVDWLAYSDASVADPTGPTQVIQTVTGRIDDTTAQLTRSGTITFTVPATIGPITNWHNLQEPSGPSPLDVCLAMGKGMEDGLATAMGNDPATKLTTGIYRTVLDASLTALQTTTSSIVPVIPHPLDPSLRTAKGCWLRLRLPPLPPSGRPKIRMITFNSVLVTQAITVTNELLGKGNGRPGQTLSLQNADVLSGTLSVTMQEDIDPTAPLVPWGQVDTLDTAGPTDSVYELDAEAGVLTFGDGFHGRIPPLVPVTGDIYALRYRYGGGSAGEVGVGAITTLATPFLGVSQVVNFVDATGGWDAETLDHAKLRARKLLSSRDRAVTVDDFVWIAMQTPDVRVGRVAVVPLARPVFPAPATPPDPVCGPNLPTVAAGLVARKVPGAVAVIAVPNETVPEPTPTPSFLRAVCKQLDAHRLVTTEVHVISPQYCRICQVAVTLVPQPGYTPDQIRQNIEARLGQYLHVLTGGADGKGFPFGGQVHIADLMSQVSHGDGVARVDSITAQFTRTAAHASPRQGQLALCPMGTTQFDKVNLDPDENVSVDVTTISVATGG